MKLEVGLKVYLKPIGNNARYGNNEVREYEIKKVGRKYFEVWDGKDQYHVTRFHIEGLKEVTNYSPGWKLYFSRQEIVDEEEHGKLIGEIRNVFDYYRPCSLTLEQLRKIKAIIESK